MEDLFHKVVALVALIHLELADLQYVDYLLRMTVQVGQIQFELVGLRAELIASASILDAYVHRKKFIL